MKVLIVEDDKFYAQRIVEYLQDRSVQTVAVRSAEDAISADLTEFEGAVIDLMLPNDPVASGISSEESRGGFSTGLCVARRLLVKKPTLQIVMLTSASNPEAQAWAGSKAIPFISKEEGPHALLSALRRYGLLPGDPTPLAFIVHGRDSGAVYELKNYIQNTLKWQEPVILREQPSGGKTIIEKFEEYARRVDCVFVLLTPDDVGGLPGTNDEKRRSRQNVIFEAGFFYANLNRLSGRIFLLYKGPLELPSDISGVVLIDIQDGIIAAGENIRIEVATLLGSQGK
jgi:CheY-like chemotaxis protein